MVRHLIFEIKFLKINSSIFHWISFTLHEKLPLFLQTLLNKKLQYLILQSILHERVSTGGLRIEHMFSRTVRLEIASTQTTS